MLLFSTETNLTLGRIQWVVTEYSPKSRATGELESSLTSSCVEILNAWKDASTHHMGPGVA